MDSDNKKGGAIVYHLTGSDAAHWQLRRGLKLAVKDMYYHRAKLADLNDINAEVEKKLEEPVKLSEGGDKTSRLEFALARIDEIKAESNVYQNEKYVILTDTPAAQAYVESILEKTAGRRFRFELDYEFSFNALLLTIGIGNYLLHPRRFTKKMKAAAARIQKRKEDLFSMLKGINIEMTANLVEKEGGDGRLSYALDRAARYSKSMAAGAGTVLLATISLYCGWGSAPLLVDSIKYHAYGLLSMAAFAMGGWAVSAYGTLQMVEYSSDVFNEAKLEIKSILFSKSTKSRFF